MSSIREMKALMAKALAQSLAMIKPLQRRMTTEEKRLEKQRKAELGELCTSSRRRERESEGSKRSWPESVSGWSAGRPFTY